MRFLNDHNMKSYGASVGPEFVCSLFQHDQTTPYTARGKEQIVRWMDTYHFILIFGDRVARS